MKETTDLFTDKTRTIHQVNKIKFDLNPLNYRCFISHSQKFGNPGNGTSPPHQCQVNEAFYQVKSHKNKISDLRIPSVRKISQINSVNYCPQFNTQVLLMEYEKDQVYTDSIKNGSQIQGQMDSKSVNSQTYEENQIVKFCLKMLSQETDADSSSLPRFTQSSLSQSYQNIASFQADYKCQNPELNSFAINLSKVQIDGRTTIMIRNIPNKYSENLLLDLFNKNHNKIIDFFYLPLDYKNSCNVGYAFLNFIHPKFIEDFYLEFHNKKWKLFNSEKICHICYARIQGAYQLSHHFNSSRRIRQSQK